MIVALIGFMACGKSTFGRAAAERLGWRFEDLDDLVMPGRSAGEALRIFGNEAFRKRESEALSEILGADEDVLLALGGGTPLREENRELLKAQCRTIWLRTSMDIVWSEIGNSDRPLAEGLTYETLEKLYKERMPAYKAAADIVFPVETRNCEAVAEELASCIKNIR